MKLLNPDFEIVDAKINPIATIRDLNKYLGTKVIPKSLLPKLPTMIQDKINELKKDKVSLNELPLSIIVEMCKYNDVNLDKAAIETLNNLLSDILKPRRRVVTDYKSLMRNMKKHKRPGQQVVLSPSGKGPRQLSSDKSILHAPQTTFRNSLGSSKFILPSDTASINLSKRFMKPGIKQSMHSSSSQGFLDAKAKIHSPKAMMRKIKPKHQSSTNTESMYRFYPANADVSSINLPENLDMETRIEKFTNPEATRISGLNPNSFFKEGSILQSSMAGRRLLEKYRSSKDAFFSPNRPHTHR